MPIFFCICKKKAEKRTKNQHMRHIQNGFVIQEHTENDNVHWDLMLQRGSVLQTYRLDKTPEEIIHNSANAAKIFDHPFRFLTYEGPVNQGKGSVHIIESGTYKIISKSHDLIKLDLKGEILNGEFSLRHLKDDAWLFARNVVE
ncbi:MAG: DNA polymerase ligase N-terminal domain-containing protein [Planctomycetota bacterium]|jgi:hypothetical protein